MRKGHKYVIVSVVVVVVIGVSYSLLVILLNGVGPGFGDYRYKIGNACTLARSSAHRIIVGCEGIKRSIEPEVFQVGWNDNYLIAITHPIEGDSQTPNNSVSHWWIMDLRDKLLLGPLQSEQEFNDKKNQLLVGDLELWSVDEAQSKGVRVN